MLYTYLEGDSKVHVGLLFSQEKTAHETFSIVSLSRLPKHFVFLPSNHVHVERSTPLGK